MTASADASLKKLTKFILWLQICNQIYYQIYPNILLLPIQFSTTSLSHG